MNEIKVYVNADGTIKSFNPENGFASAFANGMWQFTMIAPFERTHTEYVLYRKPNGLSPQRYLMKLSDETETVEGVEWNVWFHVPDETITNIDSAVTQNLALSVEDWFFEPEDGFLGIVQDSTDLETTFPAAVENDFARVVNTNTDWQFDGFVWTDLGERIVGQETRPRVQLGNVPIDPNIDGGLPKVSPDNTEIIISILNKKLDLTQAVAQFVQIDIKGYGVTATVLGDDTIYLLDAGGIPKAISFADFAAGARENFVGTFLTASGLTCPDEDDLLCKYPNGIVDPNDRLGWVANVTSTNSKWRWITENNAWQDTGEPPSIALDIGYDPLNDPSTLKTNVQEAMVDHGVIADENKTKIVVLENKTQKLNADGNISSNIVVEPGIDILSQDLEDETSGEYTAIIQAIIAEFLRNNSQDGLISGNATDITARLVKNFSTLLNKSTPDDGDLMALWDVTGLIPKNISWAEFKNAIDTSLINDQGWYINLAALQAAHPVGEDGQHATIGDTDTRAVWDSDSNDWIEVASKLYYTVTAGNSLEIRVGDNESAITAINVTLGNKEDLANKVDSIVGNEASVIKYLSAKGVYDYINPQILIFQEVRKYNKAVQVDVIISRASTDTTLFDGRIDRVEIEGGIIQNPGIAQYSIDGGTTTKNIAVYDVGSSQYVNLDLSISIVSGSYFTLLYSLSLDKWLAIDSDVDLSMIRGAGWLPIMTTSGNYALINALTLRVDNLEENQGVPALQEVQIDAPIIVTTNTIAHELVFDSLSIETNEPTILDVDGNFNHVIKSNTEPGVAFQFYAQIKNQGTPGSSAISVFHIANKSAPVTAGNFIVGRKYIINSVGTTDFTLIGASGNTIGILFTATGVGTGTGSALITFRDIRLSAVGQDVENDRYIGFSISNNDYVAPFTPGVYYTNEGVDFNILQVLFAANTIFPSGNGPSSSESTILIDSATETRSGAGTKQKDHNDEAVVDSKNYLESGKVVVATYQAVGLYQANKPEIILTTNKIVRVLFSGQGTDLTELVTLSLDNGNTDYDVEYRLTDVDLTVKNAVTHVMDLYFTGDKFIATYVDSVIANDTIPYNGPSGQFENPLTGVPIVIEEETSEEVEDVRGETLAQLVEDGDKETSLTSDGTGTQFGIKLDGTWQFLNTYSTLEKTYNIISGNKYFIVSNIPSGYENVNEIVKFIYSDGSGQEVTTGLARTNAFASGVITANKTLLANIKMQESTVNSGLFSNGYTMLIDITGTSLDGLTVDQINSIIYKYIDFGTWNAGQADALGNHGITYKTVAKNKVDLLEQGSLSSGDGSEIASVARLRSVDYIPVIKGVQYTLKSYNQKDAVALNQIIMQYDINKVFISTTGFTTNPLTLTLTSNTSYVRTIVKFVGDADIEVDDILQQLELGAEDTTFNKYIETFSWVDTGEDGFAGIGGVYDDELVQRFYKELNGLIKTGSYTGPFNVGTVAHAYQLDLSALGIKVPSASDVAKGTLQIGSDIYIATSDVAKPDLAGYFFIVSGGIRILVDKVTYPTVNDWETYVQANEEFFQAELETYLDRKAPIDGELFIGPRHTYEVSVPQGVLPSRWSATSAVNTKAQIKANTDSIVRLAKELAAQGLSISEIVVELQALSDSVGYTPNLNTVAKIVVDAINELVAANIVSDAKIVVLENDRKVSFTGSASISSSTSEPVANITTTINVSDYDQAIIVYKDSGITFVSKPINIGIGIRKKVYSKDDIISGATSNDYEFYLKPLTDTTITVWNGVRIVTTYGSPAGIVPSARAGMTVEQIIFIKN